LRSTLDLAQRQGDDEARSPPRLAFQRDRAAKRLREIAADGEAKARAAELAIHGVVHLMEGLEDLPLLIRRDADAAVFDDQLQGVGLAVAGDIEAYRSFRRELDGVGQQVEHDLA